MIGPYRPQPGGLWGGPQMDSKPQNMALDQAPLAEFTHDEMGALAHLYRGEIYRSSIWRNRLDTTTNWAVVTTGIALSVTFSDASATSLPIVLVSFLLAVFLIFEGRRYRFFDLWHTRVRVLENYFYVPLLRGEGPRRDGKWNRVLADDYRSLYFHMNLLQAIGVRLRRSYGYIFAVQIASYWSKIAVHPTPLQSMDDLWARTSVGPLPGPVVLAVGACFYGGLLLLALLAVPKSTSATMLRHVDVEHDKLRALSLDERL